MTNQNTSRPTAEKPRRLVAVVVLLLVAVAGGIYAGTRWHRTIGPMLGMKADDSSASTEGARTGDGQQLWTCGMHPQVIQDHPGDCPICHMKLTPLKMDGGVSTHDHGAMTQNGPGTLQGPGGAERKVKYWWDPMLSPPYISDKPGKSPMGMDLIPVYEDEGSTTGSPGQVVIDPAVVQNMGVRIAQVTEGPLNKSVRLVGYLDEAQPNIHEVNLRVSGWVRRLHANTEGMHVEAGDPLFDLYSPELQVAIEELIAARRARSALNSAAGTDQPSRLTTEALADAAIQKLELVGLPRTQIEALAKLDRAPETVTFTSPITGYITEKPIVEGAAVKMGDRVLRIVDYSTLWLDAQVFEKDLPFVRIGQTAVANVASLPTSTPTVDGEPLQGEVIFIKPRVDAMTRTTTVRLSIPNPSLALRPGMYATVRTQSQVADRAVLVPREAIIETGERQVAFVAQAVGRFQPRQVKMGLAGNDGIVQVVEGLAPGEAVVTSGQFLIDSESRLREAIQKFLNEKKQAGAAAPAPATQAERFDATPAQVEKVDAVVAAYLTIADALGAVQEDSSTLNMTTLISAAHALHGAVSGTKVEPLAVDVAKAAEAMKGQPIDHQRQMFSALGEKVIALVDAVPPTTAVAEVLYVLNCPMAPGGAKGDWIQRGKNVANPFFATEMKECGSQVRMIELAPPKGARR